MERKPVLLIPIFVALLSILMVSLAIFNSWLGEGAEGIMMFCEQVRDGFVKQPSNTFSNFGFISIGIYIAWLGYKNEFSHRNRMTKTLFYPAFFAGIVVFLGPGSMAMHATNTYWGGFVDLFSMFLFSTFVFSYAAMRWFNLSKQSFVLLFIGNVILCSWAYLSPLNKQTPYIDLSNYVFGTQLLLGTILELLNRYVKHIKIKAVWGWTCVFVFMLAFYIWNMSRTQDSPFCNPESLVQGHAIWHLLCALATYFLFLFYTSEVNE